jgi:hypothetical protein
MFCDFFLKLRHATVMFVAVYLVTFSLTCFLFRDISKLDLGLLEWKRGDVMKILGISFLSLYYFIYFSLSINTGYAYFGRDLGTKRITNIVMLKRLEQLKKERSNEEKESEGEKGCGMRRKRGKDQREREKENNYGIVRTLFHHYLLLLLLFIIITIFSPLSSMYHNPDPHCVTSRRSSFLLFSIFP